MNRQDKIKALLDYDYDINNLGSWEMVVEVLKSGFKGYDNMTDQEIDDLYEQIS